ncbi:hypothetical protein RB195_001154 [Necator americanus]|uniref:Bestrophin homolog n=1 Tax=Necator americanus TaxID=51031 RepID=A0ABR1DD36_NECAM
MFHRNFLTDDQRRTLEDVAKQLDQHLHDIPIDFMLGFFVSIIVTRWLTLFNNVGLIENVAHVISCCVRGSDDKTRLRRTNIIRYCVVAQLLAFRDISVPVRKRFPTSEAIVNAGFLFPHENEELKNVKCVATNMGKHGCLYGKTWIPVQWAVSLLKLARYKDESISSDLLLGKCLEELLRFRTCLLTLRNYDWVPIPIMYPQLVFLAVHLFFFIAVLSRQVVPTDSSSLSSLDAVIPLMSCLQFTFYMGWLKVAEALLNPFGEDDDDFECNFLLDRNLIVGIAIVNEGDCCLPKQENDPLWKVPMEPLYNKMQRTANPLVGSVVGVEFSFQERETRTVSSSGADYETDFVAI